AMSEGHMQLADSCVSRAEAMNPKYSLFHIGDTPVKCRADLNKKLGIRATPGDRSPAPATGGKPDPFLARHDADAKSPTPSSTTSPPGAAPSSAASPPADRGLTRLPPVDPAASNLSVYSQ